MYLFRKVKKSNENWQIEDKKNGYTALRDELTVKTEKHKKLPEAGLTISPEIRMDSKKAARSQINKKAACKIFPAASKCSKSW